MKYFSRFILLAWLYCNYARNQICKMERNKANDRCCFALLHLQTKRSNEYVVLYGERNGDKENGKMVLWILRRLVQKLMIFIFN